MSSGLFSEIKNNPWALALVIIFHLVLIVLLSINLASDEKPPMPSAQKHKIIDAVVVDANKYDERKKQEKLAAQKKIEDKKKQELERKKILEKKQQQKLATEKKKALAIAKKKEADRKAKEKKAKEKKAREKKAKEKKERQLKEKQRLEAEKKRKKEEERQRRAEEKAEFERALIEEERREEEARVQAERAARLQTQRQQYIMLIKKKISDNWMRPAGTSDEQSCEVIVTQTMTGDVINVLLQACTSDVVFQRSVERAVYKASPLPPPPDPEVFDRKIEFKFKSRK